MTLGEVARFEERLQDSRTQKLDLILLIVDVAGCAGVCIAVGNDFIAFWIFAICTLQVILVAVYTAGQENALWCRPPEGLDKELRLSEI